MEKPGQVELINSDDITSLSLQASEAVMEANVDPSKLSPEEHHRIHLLQSLASRAITEANLRILSNRIDEPAI